MKEYINNSLKKPMYLFHGSPKRFDVIEQRQAHDSNGNSENEDYCVFLTSSFIIASAYAFKDKIKELSNGLEWNFDIGYDSKNKKVDIKFENVNIDDNIYGYIYVFPYNKSYNHHEDSIQYKCYENIKPIDIVKVKFADFKDYYSINKD